MERGNTEVTIWASQMRPGGLPAICVKSGEPADRWVKRRYATAPRWTLVLLLAGVVLVGVLPYLIVRAIVSVKATGQLPFAGPVAGRLKLFSIGGLLGLLAGVVLFVGGLTVNSGAAGLAGGLLFFLALGLLIAAAAMAPQAEVRNQPGVPNDRVVVLKRVHPNFAQAVLAQQQAAAQQPAAPAPWPATTA
jgi:predicted lipid-binding transport protein (Tim44 family)